MSTTVNPERNRQIIALYAEGGLSMSEVGQRLGVSKGVVNGVITREASELIDPKDLQPHRTLFDRLDALHSVIDAVLAEGRQVPRVKVPPVMPDPWDKRSKSATERRYARV